MGKPLFLLDTAKAAVVGALLGLVLACAAAVTGYGEWGEVVSSALTGLGIFYVVALLGRLILHAIHDLVHADGSGTPQTRKEWLWLTKYGIWLGAGGVAAGAVLALAYRSFAPDGA